MYAGYRGKEMHRNIYITMSDLLENKSSRKSFEKTHYITKKIDLFNDSSVEIYGIVARDYDTKDLYFRIAVIKQETHKSISMVYYETIRKTDENFDFKTATKKLKNCINSFYQIYKRRFFATAAFCLHSVKTTWIEDLVALPRPRESEIPKLSEKFFLLEYGQLLKRFEDKLNDACYKNRNLRFDYKKESPKSLDPHALVVVQEGCYDDFSIEHFFKFLIEVFVPDIYFWRKVLTYAMSTEISNAFETLNRVNTYSEYDSFDSENGFRGQILEKMFHTPYYNKIRTFFKEIDKKYEKPRGLYLEAFDLFLDNEIVSTRQEVV